MKTINSMKNNLIIMSIICVEDIMPLWKITMFVLVKKLSNVYALDSETLPTEEILTSRDNGKNVLNYYDFCGCFKIYRNQ